MSTRKEVARKAKVKKSSVRNDWIPQTWCYNGAGYQKNKKKMLERKMKHKSSLKDYDKSGDFLFCKKRKPIEFDGFSLTSVQGLL